VAATDSMNSILVTVTFITAVGTTVCLTRGGVAAVVGVLLWENRPLNEVHAHSHTTVLRFVCCTAPHRACGLCTSSACSSYSPTLA
jgi:hypothetical protein